MQWLFSRTSKHIYLIICSYGVVSDYFEGISSHRLFKLSYYPFFLSVLITPFLAFPLKGNNICLQMREIHFPITHVLLNTQWMSGVNFWVFFCSLLELGKGASGDICVSAHKPLKWCHAQLMSLGSNSISCMNSSYGREY